MATNDRLVQEQAVTQARELFQAQGVGAIHAITSGLTDQTKTAAERRHSRLMIIELERLDRLERQGPRQTNLVLWKPPLFSFARLRALFPRKKPRRRS